LRAWKDFHFIPGMPELLAAVKRWGYPTILVTNQQGVGKGLMSLAALHALHEEMQSALRKVGAEFDGIYAATGLAETDARRKPSPSMLLEAAEAHAIDLSRSWMVGDHDNDMRAGAAAGVGTIRVVGTKAVTVSSDHEVRRPEELRAVLAHLIG
jgi:histidinol-phosphate phosphatase family protein